MVNFIMVLKEIILMNNFLSFDGEFFRQTNGAAMGNSCAPLFANLVMYRWESEFIFKSPFKDFGWCI